MMKRIGAAGLAAAAFFAGVFGVAFFAAWAFASAANMVAAATAEQCDGAPSRRFTKCERHGGFSVGGSQQIRRPREAPDPR